MTKIDKIAQEFTGDVIRHIYSWMQLAGADQIDFHRYRMRLLSTLGKSLDEATTRDKLMELIDRISSSQKFDIIEAISDKVMGESVSRYIFAKVIIAINEEWLKILDHDVDKTKAEISSIHMRILKLKDRLNHH